MVLTIYKGIKWRITKGIFKGEVEKMTEEQLLNYRTKLVRTCDRALFFLLSVYMANVVLWIFSAFFYLSEDRRSIFTYSLIYIALYAVLMILEFLRVEAIMPVFSIVSAFSVLLSPNYYMTFLNAGLFVVTFAVHAVILCETVVNDRIKITPQRTEARKQLATESRIKSGMATDDYVPDDIAADERLMALRQSVLHLDETADTDIAETFLQKND